MPLEKKKKKKLYINKEKLNQVKLIAKKQTIQINMLKHPKFIFQR